MPDDMTAAHGVVILVQTGMVYDRALKRQSWLIALD